MQYKKLSLFFYFLLSTYLLFSQIKNQNIHFISPVDFPIYLSGNFGEIRSAHFHSGIDIKTQGVVGKNIHSVEDGYISRIKISANGYGKTIYICHPNGYTTVYGHLNSFSPEVEKLVKSLQYKNNKFEINYFPEKDEFPVKKGQIIAQSGNTGSSGGPHLHFEIRLTDGQIPVNPLLFDFNIEDTISPVLYHLFVYPLSSISKVNNEKTPLDLILRKNKGFYSIADTNKIIVSGEVGFGIEMNDFLNNSRNKCGIYSLSLFINDSIIYNYSLDKFSFYETGYVKSHIDFSEKNKSNKTVQKTYIDPNNKLSIYKSSVNRGIYTFKNDTSYNVKFIAADAYGNKSELAFLVYGKTPELIAPQLYNPPTDGIFMNWETENTYENDEIKIKIPKNCLFDTIYFKYSRSKNKDFLYSSIHSIHNKYTPINKNYTISIKTLNLPEELKKKAFIAQLQEDNSTTSIGGEIINDYIVSETNSFGDFAVMIDTIPPVIKPIAKKNNLPTNKIKFLISDNLSGIKLYNGYIDNSWALFEYDLKNDLLFYSMDEEKIGKNKEHELELFVVDNCGNISTYYTKFHW